MAALLLRRASLGGAASRVLKPRIRGGAEHERYPGGWWGPGTHEPSGYLFGESPPPPGQTRQWEDWELPYYATMVTTAVLLGLGLSAKPDTSITGWAREQALLRLEQQEAETAE
eukprot:TRINITY_DN2538_c0_g1_i1.p1 TRINITY_DN2538_c0_g1~~TRINITY_DN2538_c0_g1_i1.p1  ORF type:complete len:114 (+),score=5.83 TRINITY_DN2538_c0_g1_i1:76-417(+)